MTGREILPEGVLVFDPPELDAALIGMTAPQPTRTPVAVYDYDKLIEAYVSMGMTSEEAEEWIEFNTLGAWLGERTPIVILRIGREEGQ